ncbi:PQQ-binding-like beta-propeller repeat protein [Dactylosporangium sp. CA-152071]|uniref:outer membrane protein assembly factor BamB family protein n=1 Tax=Dactylosporangium sp. CA-152071 TaxID=3239933 RepID=UPI003D93D5F9
MNPVIRGAGLLAIALGTIAVIAGLVLPWTIAGSRHPDLVTVAGIVFLGPLISGLCVAYTRAEPRRFRLTAAVAAVAGLAATLVAVGLARLVEPSAGVGLGGPVTVAGAAAAALGWVLLTASGPGALPSATRPWLAIVAAGVVLVIVAGFGVDYAREGRFVDSTTAGDPPPAGGDQTWPLPYVGVQLVGVHDQLAIVRAEDGVRAVWLSSGAVAWRYLRSDLPTQTAGLVDGTVVVVFGTDDGVLVAALDAGSGQVRFSGRYTSGKMASVHGAGKTVVLAGAGIGAGDLLAIDATTGTLLWRWTPARNGGPCDVTDLATTAETVAVALRCRAQGVDDVAVGLTATTGAERWSWHTVQRSATELRVHSTGDGFVTITGTSPRRAVFMDAVTGTVGTRHDPAGALAVATPSGLLLYAEPSGERAHLTAVDPHTGTVKWDVGLPGLGSHQPLTATTTADKAYVVWRAPDGRLRLIGARTTDGSATEDRTITCPTRCPEVSVAATPAHAVVTTREDKATELYLSVT